MFEIFIAAILIFTSFIIYKTDSINIVLTTYKKVGQLNDVNKLLNKDTNTIGIYIKSSLMISKMLYMSFIQYMTNNIKKINKNTYELTYVLNGKQFKILIKDYKGPKMISYVTDDKDNDISDRFLELFGPSNDFHNTVFTPRSFGSTFLTIGLMNEEISRFEENEQIL